VLRTGLRHGTRGLRVHYLERDNPEARLGLVVPKRIAPRALDRNRVKRVARESFRHWRGTLPPLDLVLVAVAGAGGMSRAELRQGCDQLFGRLARN
jgi:ribonuclease P protein component